MKVWRTRQVAAAGMSTLIALSLALGCGSSTHGSAQPAAGAGGSAVGSAGASASGGSDTGASGTGGSSCTGSDCTTGGSSSNTAEGAAQACRDYFTAVCARIRECGAPKFRPCESPIDVCPDILFSAGSNWTIAEVQACTEKWKTQDCTALTTDQGPACSVVPGKQPVGSSCVFDVQCQSDRCNGGIVPTYKASCGVCADVAPSHGTCDMTHVCRSTERCNQGTCVDLPPVVVSCTTTPCPTGFSCLQGACVQPLPAGSPCTAASKCAAGLGCQIEIVPEPGPEPTIGVCQPLPAIGQACLPTFIATGLCVDGGTCTGRPTGMCVPLVEVGGECGFTRCVAGAYCQVLGYDTPPPYICYARGNPGDACPHQSADLGRASCADGLACACATANCQIGACAKAHIAGEPCTDFGDCASGMVCQGGLCLNPTATTGTVPDGAACARQSTYGRETAGCMNNSDCLCVDADCTQPICATPRMFGETCDSHSQICRQGLACTQGTCADAPDRNIESKSCDGKP